MDIKGCLIETGGPPIVYAVGRGGVTEIRLTPTKDRVQVLKDGILHADCDIQHATLFYDDSFLNQDAVPQKVTHHVN